MRSDDRPWIQTKEGKKPRLIDQHLLNACYFGNIQGVRKYLKMGADPNYMEERDGWRPLHYAARWGDIPLALLLIKYGADINGLTNSKEAAIHKCARWNRKEMAEILIKMGAILYKKNSDGYRAMDLTTDMDMKNVLNPYD